jgi:hypothetical protein
MGSTETGSGSGGSNSGSGSGGSKAGSGGSSGSSSGSGGSSGSSSGSGGSKAGSGGSSGSSSGSGGSTGSGSGSGGSTGSGSGGDSGGTLACSPGIPATTQLRRMLNREYDATVRDLLGLTSVNAGSMLGAPSTMLYSDFEGPMVPDAWRIYQDVGAAIAKAVMADTTMKGKFMSCDPSASGCMQTTIKNFGRLAFRRALTNDEVTRFMALGSGTPAGTPAEVAEATLYAFLVSPSFLYIPELNETKDSSGKGIQLSSTEVAARLSYMLWGSTPDATLNTAADANQLQTSAQILTQAQRMIMVKDKTAPLVSGFHDHWVQMDNSGQHWFKGGGHDTTVFPLYKTTSDASFSSELDNFFSDVAFANGTFQDLFLSNTAFVNQDNAAIYGLDASKYNSSFQKVTLDADQRPGFMTRAGFLSSYAHYNETAPILRGAFINIYMIGVNPGPPVAGATMMQPPPGNYKTNREKTDALVNTSATCMGCHTAIVNPPGYVMENFNGIGQWQTKDQLGGDINATATVNFGNGVTQNITSVKQMMQQIAQTPAAQSNYAQYWVSYAYGREPNAQDQCVVDTISSSMNKGSYPILNILTDLTQTDSFRMRVAGPQ